MKELLLVLVLVIVAAVFLAAARPHAVFVVRVRHGRPETTQGKVTDTFLVTVEEVFREFGLEAGEIRGVLRGQRIALWFSSGVPSAACQRLRNWWALSGWTFKSSKRRH